MRIVFKVRVNILTFRQILGWIYSCQYYKIIAYGISVFEYIWGLDGVADNEKAEYDAIEVRLVEKLFTSNIRLFLFLPFGLFCSLEKGNLLHSLIKSYNCIIFTNLTTHRIIVLFKLTAPGLFYLKISPEMSTSISL